MTLGKKIRNKNGPVSPEFSLSGTVDVVVIVFVVDVVFVYVAVVYVDVVVLVVVSLTTVA